MSWYVAVVPRVCDTFLPSSVPTGTGTQVPLQLVRRTRVQIYVLVRGRRVCDTLLFYRVAYLPGLVPRYERYHCNLVWLYKI